MRALTQHAMQREHDDDFASSVIDGLSRSEKVCPVAFFTMRKAVSCLKRSPLSPNIIPRGVKSKFWKLTPRIWCGKALTYPFSSSSDPDPAEKQNYSWSGCHSCRPICR